MKEVGNVSLVSRRHGISKSTIFTWIRESEKRNEIKVKLGRKVLVEGDAVTGKYFWRNFGK